METFRGLQEPAQNLYKLGGRKTPAARVLQKGQGLALLNGSTGWERGCYVLSSQAVPAIKRRTIYFKGLTELVAWMAEKQQVQGKWGGPVKERKKKKTQHTYARKQEASLLKIQWENALAKSSKVPRSVLRALLVWVLQKRPWTSLKRFSCASSSCLCSDLKML